ncbi:hypothetical protein PanWU01x14_209820 [Parasponia andersonii]|uniref:Uncharacterized protein n=1 Tax=Parasponia andersonii TaxID=3476 RepID=A0A2P5BUB9_PARAD|nr:hypothetical protein PanWU01x14_209820 [Parasponia andersonii]
MAAFQDVVDECNLIDMGFKGDEFTWLNKQEAKKSPPAMMARGKVEDSILKKCG